MTNLPPMDELWAASAEVSGVEILTPAAQAVLKAYLVESWTPDEEDNGGYYKFSHRAGMAAALRAAGDTLSHPASAHTLYAIADELEGVTIGTYRCNLEDKPQ